MSNKIEDLNVQKTPESDSALTRSNAITSAEQQTILLCARTIDSKVAEKFGMLALKDVNADRTELQKLYDKAAPSEQSKQDFADRLNRLAVDNPEFVEKMVQASKQEPEKAGATTADALIEVMKKSPTRPADYENSKDVQAAFGVVASMVRIDGRGDNSTGGAKEQIVDAFNAEIFRKGTQNYQDVLVAFKAYVTDREGNIQHWEDGAPKQRYATGTPFLVLYDEPGKPPGVIVQPTDIEAVRFDPKKYTPPKESQVR